MKQVAVLLAILVLLAACKGAQNPIAGRSCTGYPDTCTFCIHDKLYRSTCDSTNKCEKDVSSVVDCQAQGQVCRVRAIDSACVPRDPNSEPGMTIPLGGVGGGASPA